MSFNSRFPKGGWAMVQPTVPQNLGAVSDWSLIAGKSYRIIDVAPENEMVFLYTYDDLQQNLWFFTEFLLPGEEPKKAYVNRMLEEHNKIEAYQKTLRDRMMREVFGNG